MIPVSTSPEPAVAAHDVVDGCTSVRPSGSATTVALPLRSTVTPSAAAARRAAPIRSVPTSPATRANSRSWGVITTGRPATLLRRSACRASRVTPSASTHTGTSRSSTAPSSARPASSVPMPGPTAHDWVRPASATSSVATISGQRARTGSAAVPAKRTMPLVASTAAPEASTAAPG